MFKPVKFTPPPALLGLLPTLQEGAAQLSGLLTDGLGKLEALGLPALNVDEALTGAVQALRDQCLAAFNQGAAFLPLTPFTHGVGTRQGGQNLLTPAAGLQMLATRLPEALAAQAGAGAGVAEGEQALCLLCLAGAEMGNLTQALAAFNGVFPLPELQKAQRRAEALAKLEQEKFVIPPAPAFPAFTNAGPQSSPLGRGLAAGFGAATALKEAQAFLQQSPAQNLAQLGQKLAGQQMAALQKLQELLNGLTSGTGGSGAGGGAGNGETGGQTFALYLQGSAAQLAKTLAQTAPPLDERFKCSAFLCWLGPPAGLAFFKQLFGV